MSIFERAMRGIILDLLSSGEPSVLAEPLDAGRETGVVYDTSFIADLQAEKVEDIRVIRGELSRKKKLELESSISDFENWLRSIKKLHVDAARKYSKPTFPRPTSADWIMKVKGCEVQFNTYLTSKCSFEYFRLVVLHECFHLFVQDVPNKSDAKRLRDDFGDVVMKLLDIEADYFTAMYYKAAQRASLVDIFSLYYQGSHIFGDPKIRAPKVERFIGGVLSIANAYFNHPGRSQPRENRQQGLDREVKGIPPATITHHAPIADRECHWSRKSEQNSPFAGKNLKNVFIAFASKLAV